MRRQITIAALLVMVIMAFAFWWYSPAQVLKRRCNHFFNVISFTEKMKPETRQLRVMELGEFLDTNVVLSGKDLPDEISNPAPSDELQAIFACVCDACRFVTITERNMEFIGIDGKTATVQATIKLAIDHPEGAKLFNGTHRLMISWQHAAQRWRITKVSWEKLSP